MSTLLKSWIVLLALLVTGVALAEDDELLPAEQAFPFTVTVLDPTTLRAEWNIAKGYYLYKDMFSFSTDAPGITLGTPRFPTGKIKQDEAFGTVEIFQGHAAIEIPFSRSPTAPADFVLTVGFRGCAEIGVCYPPQRETVPVALPQATTTSPGTGAPMPLFDSGAAQEDEVLEPDAAFRFDADVAGDAVTLRWQIAPHHYLYRDKFVFRLQDGSTVTLGSYDLPPGEEKNDESFGPLQVFHDQVEVRIPLQRGDPGPATLQVSYQGCAELIGLCYPTIHKEVNLDPAAALVTTAAPAAAATTTAGNDATPLSEQDRLARFLLEKPLWLSTGLFFLLGVGLTFTPCVFPMIPILSSIIVGQGDGLTTRKAFTLSLTYVLAMALTYAVAGVVVALLGANLQAMFQDPWILGGFALVFVLLALSMFGFYELQMPAAIQTKLSELSNRQGGGTLIGVGIMGLLSALIVGPCVTAPLVAALIVISQTGDPVLGFGALFALGMGMGVPLLVVGTSAGKLLPRTGGWMDAVKAVFGVLLLAVAVWMLDRVLPATVIMVLWALLLIGSGVYLGALEPVGHPSSGWRKLWKGAGLAFLIHGALLLIGAAGGSTDPLQPLRGLNFGMAGGTAVAGPAAHLSFKTIKGEAALERELAAASAAGKPVMLDFYADWCVSCKEFEKYTFSDPAVIRALSGAVLLKADVTANDADDQALLRRFKLIGPPTMLFFGRDGAERQASRVVGFLGPEEFRAHVEGALR